MSESTHQEAPPRGKASARSVSASSPEQESMVVRLSRLDKMLELAGEVIIVSSNLSALSQQVRENAPISRNFAEDFRDLAITSSRISSDLHNLVTDVRTVDMTDLFARFRRLARDTGRRLGKAVSFVVEGEDVSIDKKISERIYDPVSHQIRNAISHGIEDPETRTKAGKDPVGHVLLRVRNMEHSIQIDVVDDGRGIDTEVVRAQAVRAGLVDEATARGMSPDDLFEFLYYPGFSTSTQTSTTAGRGVGMDVIRTVMQEIGGESRIQTEAGKGTTFTFVLPIVTAVNISDSLLVRARNTVFAFPILSVVASHSVARKGVTTTTGRGRSIMYLGHVLPVFDLMAIFGDPPLDVEGEMLPVLIIEHKKQRVGYIVSEFLSPQKVVISEFENMMKQSGLHGTATLSGRKMGMVVDLPQLLQLTFGWDREAQSYARAAEGRGGEAGVDQGAVEAILGGGAPRFAPEDGARGAGFGALAMEPEANGLTEAGPADGEFLREVESMLRSLNRELLQLEEKRDRETADSIFRLLHSIKGNFVMYGAEEAANIAHEGETLLERARRGDLELTDEVFDVLFDAGAFLEEVVTAFLKDDRAPDPPDKLVRQIEDFHQHPDAASVDVDLDEDRVILDATGEFYLSSRRRDGALIYQARIAFDPGDQPSFLVAYLVLRRIQGVADVLGSLPPVSDIEAGTCGNALVVLFSPREKSSEVVARLGRNLQKHYGVTRFDADQYA